MKIPHVKLIPQLPLQLGFLLIPLALGCFALVPQARAACQEGCLKDGNTVLGDDALLNNTTGFDNTAVGLNALLSNTTGANNTAIGWQALFSNSTGSNNTATGLLALGSNTTGNFNTATGQGALPSSTTGWNNTANGFQALLGNTTGSSNIALGFQAGANLTTGNNNIHIGNVGVPGDSSRIRIGQQGTQRGTFIAGIRGVTTQSANAVAVLIDSAGQLGTMSSSRRFKKEIKPMEQRSEAILSLKPVTFHYKSDSTGIVQFGLIAEEVAEVNQDLIVRDDQGKPYAVRYEAVNAMLLNEFLKEHRKVEKLEATVAQQRKDFEAAIAQVKTQVQKVSAQLQLSQSAPQTVLNSH